MGFRDFGWFARRPGLPIEKLLALFALDLTPADSSPIRYRPSRNNKPSGRSKRYDGPRDEAHRRQRPRVEDLLR